MDMIRSRYQRKSVAMIVCLAMVCVAVVAGLANRGMETNKPDLANDDLAWLAGSQTQGGYWVHLANDGPAAGQTALRWAITATRCGRLCGAGPAQFIKSDLLFLSPVGPPFGDAAQDPRVRAAIREFEDGDGGKVWYGDFGYPHAMWAVIDASETTVGFDDAFVIAIYHPPIERTRATRPARRVAGGGAAAAVGW